MQRWLALSVPSFVLAMLALLLVAWPLTTLFLALGLPAMLLPCAAILGALSALGMVHGLPARFTALQIVLVPALVWLEYRLLMILQAENTWLYGALGFSVVILATVYLFGLSSSHVRMDTANTVPGKVVRASFLPPRWWLSKKLWRSGATRLSLVVTLGLAIGMGAIGYRQALDPGIMVFMAALLAAAFASDIRSLSRRSKPAEIAALRGTGYFVCKEWATAICYGLLATLPLLWAAVVILQAHLFSVDTAHILAQVSLGATTGVLAGSLIVPESRDISGQFLATIICMALLLGIDQLPYLRSFDGWQQVTYESMLIVLLGSLAATAEHRRNNYIWRKRHV
jgi:hypothetical protein